METKDIWHVTVETREQQGQLIPVIKECPLGLVSNELPQALLSKIIGLSQLDLFSNVHPVLEQVMIIEGYTKYFFHNILDESTTHSSSPTQVMPHQ